MRSELKAEDEGRGLKALESNRETSALVPFYRGIFKSFKINLPKKWQVGPGDLICVEANAREPQMMTRSHASRAHTAAILSPLRPVFPSPPGTRASRVSHPAPPSCILHFLWWVRFFCGEAAPFFTPQKNQKNPGSLGYSSIWLRSRYGSQVLNRRRIRQSFEPKVTLVLVAKVAAARHQHGDSRPHRRRRSPMRPVWSRPVGPRRRCPL